LTWILALVRRYTNGGIKCKQIFNYWELLPVQGGQTPEVKEEENE